jgi:hypothetical protein
MIFYVSCVLSLGYLHKQAKFALERVKNKPGFIDYPDDFQIFASVLNRDGWCEGFVK